MRSWSPALWILAFVGSCWLLREAAAVVLPFLVAVLLALTAYPIVQRLTDRKVPRWLAAAMLAVATTGCLAGLGWLGIEGVRSMFQTIQQNQERIDDLWRQAVSKFGSDHLLRQTSGLGGDAARAAAGLAAGAVGSTVSLLGNILLVALYLCFILAARHHLPRRMASALGSERSKEALSIIEDLEHQTFRYVWLRTVVSLATAAGFWLILVIYGVDAALLWAVLAFVAQYVPYVGPLIAAILPIARALLQFPSPWTAFWIGLWLTGWSVFMGNVIEAKVMGNGMNLSPALILLGLAFFSWMWGVVGVFLAVPILATLKILLESAMSTRPVALLMAASPPASEQATAGGEAT